MKICKFCRQKYDKLANSHIIPEAFYRYTKSEAKQLGMISENMVMVTNTKGQLPIRKIWIGWYDKNLVCKNCEARFKPYDDYAITLLLKKEEELKPIFINNEVVGWNINNFDFNKLKLFIVSIIWRLGASELPQFRKINLGVNLDRAKDLIFKKDPGGGEEFSFLFARFADKAGRSYFADPHPESRNDAFEDLKTYRIYLGAGYIVYIKVDKRPFSSQTAPFSVMAGKPLWILRREDFILSKEWTAFKTVLSESKDMLNKLKQK